MPLQGGQLLLSDIRTLAQQESDMVNSTFISTAEWNSYINQSYFELYDIIRQKFGNDYYSKTSQIVTDGVNQLFTFPVDFLALLLVELQIATNQFVTLKRFNLAEKNRFAVPNSQSAFGMTDLRYRPNGNSILFSPLPSANQTIQLWYVPRLALLVADSDVADGLSGWLEYVVVDVAIKALAKEESDTSVMMARKAGLIQRIEAAAENRDIAQPQTVTDNFCSSGFEDGMWPGGGRGY